MEQTFVGIDVGETQLDIWLHPQDKHACFENSSSGISQLKDKILSAGVIGKIVMEATGNLEYPCAFALQEAGLPVAVVNPQFTAAFRIMNGQFAKTDAIDAHMLALFAQRLEPEARKVPSKKEREFKDLAARRRQLVTMIVSEKLRLRKAGSRVMAQSIERIIKHLEKEKRAIDEKMQDGILNDEGRHENYLRVQTIPGIGATTAANLLIEIPEFGQLSSKQIAALLGAAPHLRQSGKMQRRANLGRA